MNQEEVLKLRKEYLRGTRIQLVNMEDPYTKLRPGDKGTVEHVDDAGQIHIRWDNGEGLAIVPGVDSFQRLTLTDQIIEAEDIKAEQLAQQKNKTKDRSYQPSNYEKV